MVVLEFDKFRNKNIVIHEEGYQGNLIQIGVTANTLK